MLSARLAVLGVERLEAPAAVRPAVLHDVPLAAENRLTFEARKVLHVPVATLRLGALVGEDDLEQGHKHTLDEMKKTLLNSWEAGWSSWGQDSPLGTRVSDSQLEGYGIQTHVRYPVLLVYL